MVFNSISKFKYHLLCLLLISACHTYGQKASVEISKNLRIAKAENNLTWLEPALASHPTDSDFLITASFSSNIKDRSQITETLGVFKSADGGKSWQKKEVDCLSCSDPWISITDDGRLFLSVLGTHPRVPDNGSDLLLVFTSTDAGESWSSVPQSFKGNHDGPRTSVAPDGSVYLISTAYARDEDKKIRNAIFVGRAAPGQTEVEFVQSYIPSNLGLNFDMSSVLRDSSLFLVYMDLSRKANGGFASRNGRLKSPRTWAVKSNDQGKTFTAPKFISENAAFRPGSFVSGSGTDYQDRLFYASMSRDLRDIVFAYSSDNGDEWTQVEVEAPAVKDRSRWFPQLAMNKDGVLALAWLDKRDDTSGNCYTPYLAISTDGGNTFSKPRSVASEMSCIDKEEVAPASRWRMGCDYFGLTATADGKFHMTWPDARSGVFETWYSSITVKQSP